MREIREKKKKKREMYRKAPKNEKKCEKTFLKRKN